MNTMLPCQALFGMSRGAQIEEAIEEVTGAPCPCRQGRVCPLTGTTLLGELKPFADASHRVA